MTLAFEIEPGEPAPRARLTGGGLLRAHAPAFPAALALADARGQQGAPSRRFTYAQADIGADALASVFASLGLAPGDRIAVQLPNDALAPLVTLAAWRAGLTVVALPFLWRRYEIAQVTAELKPQALLGAGAFEGHSIAHGLCDVAAKEMSVRFVLGFGPDLPDGVAPLDSLLDMTRHAVAPMQSGDLTSPALVTFTARAGAPFAPVVHTEDELLTLGSNGVEALSLDARDVLLNPFPFSSPAGLSFALMPWLLSGCTLLQHQPFDLERFGAQLIEDGVTVTALPVPLITTLAATGILKDARSRLRRLGCVRSRVQPCDAHPGEAEIGVPLFDLLSTGDGTPPEVTLRGASGHRGALDRDEDLLQHGGFAVAASELDQLYRSFPGFLDAAAFAMPCPLLGDRILAAVVAKPAQSISREALCAFLARLDVAPYKYPERLVVVKSIPRDAQGRVLRDELVKAASPFETDLRSSSG